MVSTILVKNDLPNIPINEVSISLYNVQGQFISGGQTNSQGIWSFDIPDGEYRCYLYKLGFSCSQPVIITVGQNSHNFKITGHLRQVNESLDQRLITVYGYIDSIQGRKESNVELIINQKPANIITNSLTFDSPITVVSNSEGYFEFTLLRNVEYEVSLEGYDDQLIINTPNVASVKLQDLLFPLLLSFTPSQSNLTVSLNGGEVSLAAQMNWSDGNERPYARNDFCNLMYSTNTDLLEVRYYNGNLKINPLKAGQVTVTFSRHIKEDFFWFPLPEFINNQLVITIN